jgi:hypothetical protein
MTHLSQVPIFRKNEGAETPTSEGADRELDRLGTDETICNT